MASLTKSLVVSYCEAKAFLDAMKHAKREKSLWTEPKWRTPGRKKANTGQQPFDGEEKRVLATSDKGPWFNQPAAVVDEPQSSTSSGISKEIGRFALHEEI